MERVSLFAVPNFHQFILSIARECAWLLLILVVFWPLERLFAVHRQRLFRKGLAQDIGYFFISGLIPPLLLAVRCSWSRWRPLDHAVALSNCDRGVASLAADRRWFRHW